MAVYQRRNYNIFRALVVGCLGAALLWHGCVKPLTGEARLPQEARTGLAECGAARGWVRVAGSAAYADEPLADVLYRCPYNKAELLHARSDSSYEVMLREETFSSLVLVELGNNWLYAK